jgi:hypothetical protein
LRSSVFVAWTTATQHIVIRLYEFGTPQQANRYVENQAGFEDPKWTAGPLDEIAGGHYFYSGGEGTILFGKRNIAVDMEIDDTRPWTQAKVNELARQQRLRLP